MNQGLHGVADRRAVLTLVLCLTFLLGPSLCFSQITENLEIIFEKTYADGAPPDSLWDWGRSIDCAGDVNNDGYDDIIVAANRPSGDPLNPWLGKAYIFLGGDPIDTIPDVILTGSPYGTSVIHVAGIGRFNADQYDDVVLAQDDGQQGVKVFWGGNPMDTVPDLILETRPGLSFADDVAGAGDVNGDFIDDCILGDYSYNSLSGRALVFFGGAPPDSVADVVLNGVSLEAFGSRVGGRGDINSDGFNDFVVGAANNSEAGNEAGKVYFFLGGDPVDTLPTAWIFGEGEGHWLGWDDISIARNEENYDWVILGTNLYPSGFPNRGNGIVYVAFGGDTVDAVADVMLIGPTDSCGLGASSSGVDIDSSGWCDIVAGAPFQPEERGIYVWLGSIPFDSSFDASIKGQPVSQEPGWLVGDAGDVDGNLCREVLFGNHGAAVRHHSVWIAGYRYTLAAESPKGCASRAGTVLQNYPNPFSSTTWIPARFDEGYDGVLEILDIRGAVIRTIAVQGGTECSHGSASLKVAWDGLDGERMAVGSGVYFARLRMRSGPSSTSVAQKMLLVR